ncbi:MOSC domain-containing protein [Roseivirga sp. E12]|uniref:MOSC domain-containing protein n=1 Tax=Roseivirga sp. E12 TaxID=2819237 RepID=UPI001ABC21AA|nr:MOSC domain-containing protein [Roseivirga sp. E12]MBO3699093.1 MOSC domain-containing protein [Roseivirga sp. E12]
MKISQTIKHIYTGKPATIVHEGIPLRSSLFSRHEQNTIDVNFENINGNQLADAQMHGGLDRIAYIYSKEYYGNWEKRRPDLEFAPGVFGENLITQNAISESAVFIGDHFKIGSALFSVSGPRLPCNKLGVKMKDIPFINEFMIIGETGFYLRLEEEGVIRQGDQLERVSSPSTELSVLDITMLFIQKNAETMKKVESSIYLAKDLKQNLINKYNPVGVIV